MYLGNYQLGDRCPLYLFCGDIDQLPILPAAAPIVRLTGPLGGAPVVEYKLSPFDKTYHPGLFVYTVHLGPLFSVGRWEAVFYYNSAVETDNFDIIAGGSTDGSVIAMHWYPRPHADFLVQELDSRRLVKGRNPTTTP